LTFKNSRYNVGPVVGLLPRQQVFKDVRVPRIAGESNEEIWLAMLTHNSHCILISAMQISARASEGRWQDDWNAYSTWRACVSCQHVVTEVVV
jgi:hypothetical protein